MKYAVVSHPFSKWDKAWKLVYFLKKKHYDKQYISVNDERTQTIVAFSHNHCLTLIYNLLFDFAAICAILFLF